MSVGLVYGQSLVWSKGYGLINMSDPSRGAPTKGMTKGIAEREKEKIVKDGKITE